MAPLVLDASVVIALLDPSDAHHAAAARALAPADLDLRIPASALAEVLVVPYRMGSATVTNIERHLREYPVVVEPLTEAIAHAAARLRARHGALRLGDALVIATAESHNGDVLTADRTWTRFSRRVRVI